MSETRAEQEAGGVGLELNRGDVAVFGRTRLEELTASEIEHPRDDIGRDRTDFVVVAEH